MMQYGSTPMPPVGDERPITKCAATATAPPTARALPNSAADPTEPSLAMSADPPMETKMPARESPEVFSPSARKPNRATKTGTVQTSTTLAATLVYSSDGIQRPKCRPSTAPEASSTRNGRPLGKLSLRYAASG